MKQMADDFCIRNATEKPEKELALSILFRNVEDGLYLFKSLDSPLNAKGDISGKAFMERVCKEYGVTSEELCIYAKKQYTELHLKVS
ncbi:TPA: hypothetical protein ACG6RF_001987 [Streptococcus agalactiae]